MTLVIAAVTNCGKPRTVMQYPNSVAQQHRNITDALDFAAFKIAV